MTIDIPNMRYELTYKEAFDLETLLVRIQQGFTIPPERMPDFYTRLFEKLHEQFNGYMEENREALNILYDLENEPPKLIR